MQEPNMIYRTLLPGGRIHRTFCTCRDMDHLFHVWKEGQEICEMTIPEYVSKEAAIAAGWIEMTERDDAGRFTVWYCPEHNPYRVEEVPSNSGFNMLPPPEK